MSWFNWFQSAPSNVDAPPFVIWINQPAKLQGIRKQIEEPSRRDLPPATIYLVAHFDECLRQLSDLTITSGGAPPVRICLAKSVGAEIRSGIAPMGGQGIEIIVAERHPHPKYDELLLQTAEALPYPCRLVYHLSLDDALIRLFTSKSMIETLRRMGMKDDESLHSKMVTRRLRSAQQKVARTATGDLPAESAEEWLRLNSPPSLDKLQ